MFAFLSPQAAIAAPRKIGPDCTACGLCNKCKYPKQSPTRLNGSVLVVDSPDDKIDGLIDEKIQYMLSKHGVSIYNCTVVPASSCPGDNPESWKHCQPMLIDTLKRLNPDKIIPIGKYANMSIIDYLWQHPMELQDRWYGRRIPSRELNAWVFPIGMAGRLKNYDVSTLQHYRWLQHALRHKGRPYEVVPDYGPMVQILRDPKEIASALAEAGASSLSAFDYETNNLKCTKPGAKIYSASVAWLHKGTPKCVAFMMNDVVSGPWRLYLLSPSHKIAANLKFEDRWSRHFYGVEVRNWAWDTMISAHIRDPQMGVVGLKFAAFAELGVPFYAKAVSKLFETESADGFNMIHKADPQDLLLYNGIDSLAELDLGILQMHEAGRFKDVWSSTLPSQHYYTCGELGC